MRRADNLTIFIYRLYLNLEATTFWKDQGLYRDWQGLYRDSFTFLCYCYSILDRTYVFTFIFLKVLFIGLSGSALSAREVTVRALPFAFHSEREGTFV